MAGLLDYVSGIVDQAGSNVRGLLSDPIQMASNIIDQLAQRAAAQQAATKAAWATRDPKIMAQNALDSSQTALGFAPLGITAWHGSPHKFNKFSMDKIGTGEGAQAYGHGLYLAESPDVAKGYQTTNSFRAFDIGQEAERRGVPLSASARGEFSRQAAANTDPAKAARALQNANITARSIPAEDLQAMFADYYNKAGGALYKTDIPEEAVARFLDWDKPLSQQAPEVQAAVSNGWGKQYPWLKDGPNKEMTGAQIYDQLGFLNRSDSSKAWQEAGIHGIRYLDGGSRGAGQGSSNFVAFDPEMIRILERNGQATGAVPWQPGEWRGLLGNN